MTTMKAIKIKGKENVEVHQRLMFFRANYPEHALVTEIIELTKDRVVMRATIIDPDGRVIADGIAYEDANAGMVNKTSYIENAQTSAWGRACACLAIGIGDAVASSDEVQQAISKQEQLKKAPKKKRDVEDPDHQIWKDLLKKREDSPLQYAAAKESLGLKVVDKVDVAISLIDEINFIGG